MSRALFRQATNINTVLPDEMLEAIFLHLSPRHLARVAEVCTRWQKVLQAPGFWTWVKLMVGRFNLVSMVDRLGSRKLQGVRRMVVERHAEVSGEAVARHLGLRELVMTGTDLSGMEPGMLASVVNKMEKVDLWNTKLTTQQLHVLCQIMIKENSQLKSLYLAWNNLSPVEPQLLASVVQRLSKVQLWNTNLPTQQLTVLLCQLILAPQTSNLK